MGHEQLKHIHISHALDQTEIPNKPTALSCSRGGLIGPRCRKGTLLCLLLGAGLIATSWGDTGQPGDDSGVPLKHSGAWSNWAASR